jgi:hypothetical protein
VPDCLYSLLALCWELARRRDRVELTRIDIPENPVSLSAHPAVLAPFFRSRGGRRCAAKNETALDRYQVRKHVAWYRHVTLTPAAQAWLAVAATGPASTPPVSVPGQDRLAREGQRPADNVPARRALE